MYTSTVVLKSDECIDPDNEEDDEVSVDNEADDGTSSVLVLDCNPEFNAKSDVEEDDTSDPFFSSSLSSFRNVSYALGEWVPAYRMVNRLHVNMLVLERAFGVSRFKSAASFNSVFYMTCL